MGTGDSVMTQHRIIRREEWGMLDFKKVAMRLPVKQLYVHHSVTPGTWDGIHAMRQIDEQHANSAAQGKSGFAYSWAIHPYTGEVFEGKGLYYGAHTLNHNATSFGIVFLGDFHPRFDENDGPIGLDRLSPVAVDSFQWLVDLLKRQGSIEYGTLIDPHSLVRSTACPGDTLRAAMPVLRLPWMPPVTIPDLPDEDEDEMAKPNMLLRFDGDDLVVAQYEFDYQRVNGPQFEEFTRQGVKTVTVEDGKDWGSIKELARLRGNGF